MDAPGPEPAPQSPSPQAESTETASQSQSQTPLQHETTGTAGQPQSPPPPQPPQPETTETTGQPQPQAPPIPRTETSHTAGESQPPPPPPPPPPQTEIKETAGQPQPKQSIWKKVKVSKIRGVFRAAGLLLVQWFTRRGWKEKRKEEKEKAKEEEKEKEEKEKAEEEEKEKAEEKKPHPKWFKTEASLEDILEKAFTKLLEHEYASLTITDQNCLLKFAVFPLDSEVKKQAMTYWWMAEMDWEEKEQDEKKTTAEKLFKDLAGAGFIEPKRNSCTETIHGCRVNPLVHWMVKYKAKKQDFADLDHHGSPSSYQLKSKLLCLTERSRNPLDQIKKVEPTRDKKEAPNPAMAASSGSVHATSDKEEAPNPAMAASSGSVHATSDKNEEAPKSPQHTTGDAVFWKLEKLEKKEVLFNVSLSKEAYRLPATLLPHLCNLVVLQLGRWNSEEKTYIEVEGLETLQGIGGLKKLKYLGLRGLSRLTKLPDEVGKLKKLIILDMRGCQNLVTVVRPVMSLARLTHLDLTECYMLEHIAKGVSSLTELQVFKGFVFGGSRRRQRCKLSELQNLRKLRKLSINITSDAKITNSEMRQLKDLSRLSSLTITWGEIPDILKERKGKKNDHLERYTTLELPMELEKLDLRCYPAPAAPNCLKDPKKLKKLYVRGGELKNLNVTGENNIERLRLRYLYNFEMKWEDLLEKFKRLRFIEIMVKKEDKSNEDEPTVAKKEDESTVANNEEKKHNMQEMMKILEIPESALDENGVWVKDEPIPAKPAAAAGTEQSNNGGPSGSTNTDGPQKVKHVSGDGDTDERDGDTDELNGKETQTERTDITRAVGESTEEKDAIVDVKGASSGTIADTLKKNKEHTSSDGDAGKITEEETQRGQTDTARTISESAKEKDTIPNVKPISSDTIANALEMYQGDASGDGDIGRATEEETQSQQIVADTAMAVSESTKEKETIPNVKGNSSSIITNALEKSKGDASGNGDASKTSEEETQREQTDTVRAASVSAKEKETILSAKGISSGAIADTLGKGKGDANGDGDMLQGPSANRQKRKRLFSVLKAENMESVLMITNQQMSHQLKKKQQQQEEEGMETQAPPRRSHCHHLRCLLNTPMLQLKKLQLPVTLKKIFVTKPLQAQGLLTNRCLHWFKEKKIKTMINQTLCSYSLACHSYLTDRTE